MGQKTVDKKIVFCAFVYWRSIIFAPENYFKTIKYYAK